jgi:thiamine pyrophosphate-dependent acetolactate synthase large subunit-like protein
MGYAVPAANALQLRDRRATVAAFLGDGSLLMRMGEIGVAVEHELPCTYVVWMDGALSQIQVKQRRQHLREVGTRLPAYSGAAIAEALGADGCDVSTVTELESALQSAATLRRPTLIGAHVSQEHKADWFELLRG